MIHDGHRERLRAKFIKAPSSLEDHELFELLLFFSIPRINTNDIAHELLNRCGSIKDIVDTGFTTLQSVPGIGESSAVLLRVVSEITARYEKSKRKEMFHVNSHDVLATYLKSLFVGVENEVMYLMMFDNSRHLIACKKVAEGTACSSKVSLKEIIAVSLEHHATGIIITHNHPKGHAIPSGSDLSTTRALQMLTEQLDITLIEHFIVSRDECMPILNPQKAHLYNTNKIETE